MDARTSYREAAVCGASPVQLVICLYDQAIEDLRRALSALGRGDIRARTRAINHAIVILGHLEDSLNKDQGGEVARNLERFYHYVRAGLVDAHRRQSAAAFETQISHLMLVRDAWSAVEQGNRFQGNHGQRKHAQGDRAHGSEGYAATQPDPASSSATPDEGEPYSFAEWNA